MALVEIQGIPITQTIQAGIQPPLQRPHKDSNPQLQLVKPRDWCFDSSLHVKPGDPYLKPLPEEAGPLEGAWSAVLEVSWRLHRDYLNLHRDFDCIERRNMQT